MIYHRTQPCRVCMVHGCVQGGLHGHYSGEATYQTSHQQYTPQTNDADPQQGDQPPEEQGTEGTVDGHGMQDEGGSSTCVRGGDIYIKLRV